MNIGSYESKMLAMCQAWSNWSYNVSVSFSNFLSFFNKTNDFSTKKMLLFSTMQQKSSFLPFTVVFRLGHISSLMEKMMSDISIILIFFVSRIEMTQHNRMNRGTLTSERNFLIKSASEVLRLTQRGVSVSSVYVYINK